MYEWNRKLVEQTGWLAGAERGVTLQKIGVTKWVQNFDMSVCLSAEEHMRRRVIDCLCDCLYVRSVLVSTTKNMYKALSLSLSLLS